MYEAEGGAPRISLLTLPSAGSTGVSSAHPPASVVTPTSGLLHDYNTDIATASREHSEKGNGSSSRADPCGPASGSSLHLQSVLLPAWCLHCSPGMNADFHSQVGFWPAGFTWPPQTRGGCGQQCLS